MPTIRVGDKIMVVIPEFFERCGFELQMTDVLQDYGPDLDLYTSSNVPWITTNASQVTPTSWITSPSANNTSNNPVSNPINNPINTKIGVRTDLDKRISDFLHNDKTAPWYNNGKIDIKVQDGILRLLAYAVLQKRDFGGKEIKIFKYRNIYFSVGSIATVIAKKIVRTGVYNRYRIKGRNNLILLITHRQSGA
ncbi:MAG: hypothetical protein Q8Q89_00915, partial [bacterium]|nr:hypothetical protein [bacterium]